MPTSLVRERATAPDRDVRSAPALDEALVVLAEAQLVVVALEEAVERAGHSSKRDRKKQPKSWTPNWMRTTHKCKQIKKLN